MHFLVTSMWILVLIYTITTTRAEPPNCNIGAACDKCEEGYYNFVGCEQKVCCPDCSKYFISGTETIDGIQSPYCRCDALHIVGNCWKGIQCEKCLAGSNSSNVGHINSYPVCCENCEQSGIEFRVLGDSVYDTTGSECNCRHNEP